MLSTRPRFLTLFSCGLLLAACDHTPAGPDVEPLFAAGGAVEREIRELEVDLDSGEVEVYVTYQCTADGEYTEDGGELVRLSGKIRERHVAMQTPGGHWYHKVQTWASGLHGTGMDSGELFRVREDFASGASQGMHHNDQFRYRLRLVGTTTRRSFHLVHSGRYVTNANGVTVVEREAIKVECR